MKNFLVIFFIIVFWLIIQWMFGMEFLMPLSIAFFLTSTAIGIWLSLEQYRLKIKSEKAEVDVKLMTLFTKIMSIAHARGGYQVSDSVIEKLFEYGALNKDSIKDIENLKEVFKSAILTLPVGVAEQDAAIAAIAKLADRHEQLREVAIEGLNSIKSFKPEIATKYIDKLSNKS